MSRCCSKTAMSLLSAARFLRPSGDMACMMPRIRSPLARSSSASACHASKARDFCRLIMRCTMPSILRYVIACARHVLSALTCGCIRMRRPLVCSLARRAAATSTPHSQPRKPLRIARYVGLRLRSASRIASASSARACHGLGVRVVRVQVRARARVWRRATRWSW